MKCFNKIKIIGVSVACLIWAGASLAEPTTVSSSIGFSDDAVIKGAIKTDCELSERFPEFIDAYGDDLGVDITVSSNASKSDPAFLHVEIADAVSEGNAWTGHRKYVRAKGTLYQGGKKVASFIGQRQSGGGAFGGYKGSCSVLGRSIKALGQDIVLWLKNPQDGEQLGDLR